MESTNVSDCLRSAEEVGNNEDLLTIILVRVPAKSLVRFKCVSKDWLSLICDSKFSNDHTGLHKNPSVSGIYIDSCPLINLSAISLNGQQSLPKLNFLTSSFGWAVRLRHSCNGLMLCSRGSEIIMCNPTTQKFKVVASNFLPSDSTCVDMFVAFYPMISIHYKVVLVFRYEPNDLYDVDIYSSESETWSKKSFKEQGIDPFTDMVLCNGAIYWVSVWNILGQFDIDKEKLTTIQLPSEPMSSLTALYFGEHNGHLFCIQTPSCISTEIQTLEMDMQNFKWTIKYKFDLALITDTLFCAFDLKAYISCLIGGDEEETILFFLGDIFLFNLKNYNRQYLHQVLPCAVRRRYVWFHAFKFTESLASV